jgi:hypothetical protein
MMTALFVRFGFVVFPCIGMARAAPVHLLDEKDAYLNQLSHYAAERDIQMARDTCDHLMGALFLSRLRKTRCGSMARHSIPHERDEGLGSMRRWRGASRSP